MTVGEKMHHTLATLQGCAGEMKSYALETQDSNAKKMFSDYADQLETITRGFKGRVNYIEQQEPQYKVFEQAQQQH
ncbi:MAG: DUF1657 domain-containing protein [Eubacteriales bacterium]|jgi:outer membrane biogenesis lipoprotein LolB|nr:DUF1657 domain-containing protein [Bacillota bacterium]MBV1726864.1 DUF1657 domain-containing protein [Desulforudis sp.]MDP3049912.1 DUF1657 domain-containing protein [Eubacteriales bacterium]MDQ7788562.1 DUF1657 domain-containing protein [Clostridia bacterium]MBU4554808.1 DUF1657 domain-containing protein [Bacillota bacterium]